MAEILLSNVNRVKSTGDNNRYPVKSITETVINGFFTMDRRWTVQYWNKAAEKLLHVAAEDIVGKNLWEQFAGIIPIEFYTAYPKAFLLELPFHFEEYWGEVGAWFDVIIYHCDDTLSISFKSSNQRIPAEHIEHPEQRLETLNELYRFITEVSNDCLWEWDLQTQELFWIDGGHKRNFGYNVENAFIPRSFWESRVHPDDKKRIATNIHNAITGSSNVWEDDYRFQKADGTYAYVHDHGYIIYDRNKQAARMIGTTLDITDRKLTEIKLLATEKRLAQMEASFAKQQTITDAILQNSKPANIKQDILMHGDPKLVTLQTLSIQDAVANITLSIEMLEPLLKGDDLKLFTDVITRNTTRINNLTGATSAI